MLKITLANTSADLEGILKLQKENHFSNLSAKEAIDQGFVTVKHEKVLLQRMNQHAKSIIAKDDEKLIAYNIVMTKSFRKDIPILVPMFEQMDLLRHKGLNLSEVDYVVCGQICIAKAYRGKGLFKQLYRGFRNHYSKTYPLILTEIAKQNKRSIRAHIKIGFDLVGSYQDAQGNNWELVLWDWSD